METQFKLIIHVLILMKNDFHIYWQYSSAQQLFIVK